MRVRVPTTFSSNTPRMAPTHAARNESLSTGIVIGPSFESGAWRSSAVAVEVDALVGITAQNSGGTNTSSVAETVPSRVEA